MISGGKFRNIEDTTMTSVIANIDQARDEIKELMRFVVESPMYSSASAEPIASHLGVINLYLDYAEMCFKNEVEIKK